MMHKIDVEDLDRARRAQDAGDIDTAVEYLLRVVGRLANPSHLRRSEESEEAA